MLEVLLLALEQSVFLVAGIDLAVFNFFPQDLHGPLSNLFGQKLVIDVSE